MQRRIMSTNRLAIAAAVAVTLSSGLAYAGTNSGYTTISLSGSTAMRTFTTSAGIVFLPTGQAIFLSNGTFVANGGKALKLAPLNAGSLQNTASFQDVAGIRLEWHEQGATEGVLELVNDQIGAIVPTPSALSNRSPTVGNPTWVGGNPFTSAATANGYVIDSFVNPPGAPNAQQQSKVQMAISDVKPIQSFSYTTAAADSPAIVPGTKAWALQPGQVGYGKGNTAAVDAGASNIAGLGVAKSRQQLQDQVITNIADAANPAAPWTTAGVNNLQTNTVAISATAMVANPGTGLTKINKTDTQWLQLAGRLKNGANFNVAARDVNSGTRNTFATNTGIDSSWAVGENDNGNGLVTNPADADSQYSIGKGGAGGARDPLMRFSGKTAGGGQLRPTVQNNRMSLGTLSLPDAIGSVSGAATATPLRALRYNAGTDQVDANFISPNATTITDGTYVPWQQQQYVTVKNTSAAFAGLTQTQWKNTTDLQTGIKGDTANVSTAQTGTLTAGSADITNLSNTAGYVVGQAVTGTGVPAGTVISSITRNNSTGAIVNITLSSPSTAGGTVGNLAFAGGDVANFRANILNAPANVLNFTSVANPADQLVQQGYVLPQFMIKTKDVDGGATSNNGAFDINSNPTGYSSSLRSQFIAAENALGTASHINAADPSTITAGSSAYYGQGRRGASTGVVAAPNVALAKGNIALTGSNYLFGNFNNNGIRDFSSFKTAAAALKALEASGLGKDANAGGNNNTVISNTILNTAQAGLAAKLGSGGHDAGGTTPGSLDDGTGSTFSGQRGASGGGVSAPNAFGTGVTKGDLIVMGDYDGSGIFDGRNLYLMARGTALSDNIGTDTLSSMDAVRTGVLRKNDALDYLHGYYTNVIDSGTGLYTKVNGIATATMESEASVDGGNGFDKFDVLRNGNTGANARLNAKAINDALTKDYGNLDDVMASPVDLISAKVIDDGTTVIGYNDLKAAIYHLQGRDVDPNRTGNATDDSSQAKFLLNGDANFSGKVDFTDLSILLSNYNAGGKKWSDGEFAFNVTHTVDFADLSLLLSNYNASSNVSIQMSNYGVLDGAAYSLLESKGFTLVPEPASLGIIGLGGLILSQRRRRRA